MQVLRQRGLIWDNLWWDKKIAQLEGKFRIETRPLSKTYLLRNLNSGELQVFASFGKLLVGLGKIRNFPLLDEHLLGDEGHYYLRLRALLDIESLPSPLRPWKPAPDALEAGFDIRNARTTLVDGVYLLDADISFVFSEEALEAIENGVPVTIILEMQVLRQRGLIWDNLWWDKKIAQLEGKFRIETRPLSKTYLLRNLNSGELQVFASFGKLLVGLGKIRNFPLLDEHLLGDEGHYYLRLRALLDIESLPSPLRPWAYVSALWRLESDWYRWPIER